MIIIHKPFQSHTSTHSAVSSGVLLIYWARVREKKNNYISLFTHFNKITHSQNHAHLFALTSSQSTHPHSHPLTLSHTFTHTLTHPHMHTLTHIHALTNSQTHTLPHSHTHVFTHSPPHTDNRTPMITVLTTNYRFQVCCVCVL